jgi:hypothetical protein
MCPCCLGKQQASLPAEARLGASGQDSEEKEKENMGVSGDDLSGAGAPELSFPRSALLRLRVDAKEWGTLAAVADHNAHGEDEGDGDGAGEDEGTNEESSLEQHLTTMPSGASARTSGWTARIREQAKLLLSSDRNLFASETGNYRTFISSLHKASMDTKSDLLVGLPPSPPLSC